MTAFKYDPAQSYHSLVAGGEYDTWYYMSAVVWFEHTFFQGHRLIMGMRHASTIPAISDSWSDLTTGVALVSAFTPSLTFGFAAYHGHPNGSFYLLGNEDYGQELIPAFPGEPNCISLALRLTETNPLSFRIGGNEEERDLITFNTGGGVPQYPEWGWIDDGYGYGFGFTDPGPLWMDDLQWSPTAEVLGRCCTTAEDLRVQGVYLDPQVIG